MSVTCWSRARGKDVAEGLIWFDMFAVQPLKLHVRHFLSNTKESLFITVEESALRTKESEKSFVHSSSTVDKRNCFLVPTKIIPLASSG